MLHLKKYLISIIKQLKKKMSKEITKEPTKLVDVNNCKRTDNTVITLISKFKNDQNNIFNNFGQLNGGDLYTRFINYIKQPDKFPRSIDIERDLNINRSRRKELIKQAIDNREIVQNANKTYSLIDSY